MKHRKWKFLIALILGFALVLTLAKSVISQPSIGENLLIEFAPLGQVKIRRWNWLRFENVSSVTRLASEDRLLLAKNAFAKVFCSNMEEWYPPDGQVSIVSEGCGISSHSRPGGNDIFRPRAINNPNIPYIISPRNTKLLDNPSVLRWNSVEGVDRYQVRVTKLGFNWEIETNEAEAIYPDTELLQPESHYWLIVETDERKSTDEEVVGFTMLDEVTAQRVRETVAAIKSKDLGSAAETLTIAYLYWDYELNAEAIAILEREIAEDRESVAVDRLLGDFYRRVGLNRLARERYTIGLERVRETGDLESLAAIQKGLAITNAIIDVSDRDEARRWFILCRESYANLGDVERVQKLDDLRKELLREDARS